MDIQLSNVLGANEYVIFNRLLVSGGQAYARDLTDHTGSAMENVLNSLRTLRRVGMVYLQNASNPAHAGVWHLTELGKLFSSLQTGDLTVLPTVEYQALAKKKQAAKKAPTKPAKVRRAIIWCPTASQPPRVIQDSAEAAKKVAVSMAKRHGADFYVAELVALVEAPPKPKPTITDL